MVSFVLNPPRNAQIDGFLCVLYSLNSPIARCDIALTLAFWQHLESKSNSLSHSGASGSLECESELDFHSKNRRFARVSSSLTRRCGRGHTGGAQKSAVAAVTREEANLHGGSIMLMVIQSNDHQHNGSCGGSIMLMVIRHSVESPST